ncbi:MAG TPA: outer membrane beta-barrel protein [Gallionella sp.]|nr:outer membrane beta-barrel protein [Gallionella sp.]
MNKIVVAALLSAFIATPAFAAEGKNSIGINYGLDLNGVFGVQGEFDISSSMPNKAPVSLQVFWKNYSQSYGTPFGTYQYSYNGLGAAAIYDFGSVIKTNSKIRPYAGLGLITLNSTFSGPNSPFVGAADTGGLYVTAGARYELTPQVSADLNYNNYGGLTIGAIVKF